VTFVSYAQNFEDVILWRALHGVEGGRYIDIGAHDPVVDSVSMAFYEAGWRGIHVEPTPHYAARLREARPDEIVIEAAVTDDLGPIDFYEIPETGLSTGKAEIADHHSESGFSKRKIFAPCIRLDKLLAMERGDIHWLKIDVEGMEPDVLRSWGKSRKRPWVLVIESTLPGTQEAVHDKWIHEVLDRGYSEVFFDGLSRYFLHHRHAELTERFSTPANVFDRFEITDHHFSAMGLRGHSESLEKQLIEEHEQAERVNRELIATTQHALLKHEQERQELHREADTERQRANAIFSDMQRELRDAYRAIEETRGAGALQVDKFLQAEAEHRRAMEVAREEAASQHRNLLEAEKEHRRAIEAAREEAVLQHGILIEAEKEHRRAIEALYADRQAAESQWQRESNEREEVLRSDLGSVQAELANGRISQARLEERLAAVERLREEIGRQLDFHRAALEQADNLIRNAAAVRPGRWRQIGQALGLSGPDPASRALASWSLPIPLAASQLGTNISINSNASGIRMPLDASRSRNPYLRADSLSELLSWHDVDFVRCAYVTILGRQPDPDGEAYYLDRVRRGVSKLHVLRQLRTAPEAGSHDPGIAGLDRALKQYRLSQLPILGWLFTGTAGAQIEGGVQNRLRAIENSLGVTLEACQQLAADQATLRALIASAGSSAPTIIVSQQEAPAPAAVKPALPLSSKAEEIFAVMARVR
jgi:FkbM family methyltransferase